MKIKNKGKVYPSPSSSSFSSSSSSDGDYLSMFKLLPAAIITLASVLPLEDREVLAYLITRSIKTTTTTPPSSSIIQRKSSKKTAVSNNSNSAIHKPPVFDCDCFDCYTSYWFRWDSSANRELIHQAIEAFEDHLTNGESQKSKKNGKAKRRDKTARRFSADNSQVVNVLMQGQPETSVLEKQVEESQQSTTTVVADEILPENDVAPVSSPTKEATCVENNDVLEFPSESTPAEDETAALAPTTAAGGSCTHKGLARKVLPDVLGLFNSRLWSLWSPNV